MTTLSQRSREFLIIQSKGDKQPNTFSLRQGSRSIAEYSVDLRILAAESRWNDGALQGIFMQGLNDQLKDVLAAKEDPDSLESLISLAIRLDNRLREHRRERVSRLPLPSTTRSSTPPCPCAKLGVSPSPQVSLRHLSPGSSEEEHLQLGRTMLSSAEHLQRMRAGVCIYCGQSGHFLAACPLQPRDGARQ
ncbi:hypothetical protein LDENG_00167330 [Lucifuga dentata]|nr:hypothetical protein LDENG_00167330 [Lucifuga dentata]